MIQRDKILHYAKAKPHAEHEYKEAWEADILTVGGKAFARFGAYRDGRPIVTLKANPEKALILREAYEGVVIPGYYSDKKHWISIFLDVPFEDILLFGLVDDSYALVLVGLPQKVRDFLGAPPSEPRANK